MTMRLDGYQFGQDDLALLLLRRFYPERTDRESEVIHAFLLNHGQEYDRFGFSIRIGQGVTPDPSHLPAVQQNAVFSSMKRIDALFWSGPQPTIIEVKYRVTPASLGQILTYRQLFLEAVPDAPDPRLIIIGRYSDDDTTRVLQSHGITVYLYEPPATGAPDDAGRV
jgi:hypothetical protein